MKVNNTPELKKAEWATKWEEMKEFNSNQAPLPKLERFVENMFATAPDSFWATNAKHDADFEKYLFEASGQDMGTWV